MKKLLAFLFTMAILFFIFDSISASTGGSHNDEIAISVDINKIDNHVAGLNNFDYLTGIPGLGTLFRHQPYLNPDYKYIKIPLVNLFADNNDQHGRLSYISQIYSNKSDLRNRINPWSSIYPHKIFLKHRGKFYMNSTY